MCKVDTEHNYSRIFHDPERRKQIADDAKLSKHKQPCYFQKSYRSPESVDQTAYVACVFDEVVSFGVDTGCHFSVADVIGMALFLGVELMEHYF